MGSEPVPKGEGDSRRILIVEDERIIARDICKTLEEMGHVVCGTARSSNEALDQAAVHRPDVVLMDIRLLGSRDGIDAAEEINHRLGIGSIFVTANTDPQTRRRAEAVRPIGFLEKPLTQDRLRRGLSSVIDS